MARPSAKAPIQTYVFGSDEASITFVFWTGFVGSVAYAAGLDPDARTIRAHSMFGRLIARSNVRIVLVEHPARPIDPDSDFEEIARHVQRYVVACGISRGGQVAAQFHRWLNTHRGYYEAVGLVLISTPTYAGDLVQARIAKGIELLKVPYSWGKPIMWLIGGIAFTPRRIRREMRGQGRRDEIRDMVKSARRSSWMIAACRALATTNIRHLSREANDRVIVANVQGDTVVHAMNACVGLQLTYEDCLCWTIAPTTMHGCPEVDLRAYREFWDKVFIHFSKVFDLDSR
jgi:hypothetical protein